MNNGFEIINYNKLCGGETEIVEPFFCAIEDFPYICENHPGTREEYFGTRGNHPGTREEYPGTRENHPGTREEYPGTRENHPGTHEEYPRTSGEQSGTCEEVFSPGESKRAIKMQL